MKIFALVVFGILIFGTVNAAIGEKSTGYRWLDCTRNVQKRIDNCINSRMRYVWKLEEKGSSYCYEQYSNSAEYLQNLCYQKLDKMFKWRASLVTDTCNKKYSFKMQRCLSK